MKFDISFSKEIKDAAPGLKVIQVEIDCANTTTPDELTKEMEKCAGSFKALHTLEMVNKRLPIAATREVYKKLGKDPNRYRPSAEALCRRIVNGNGLYKISLLVDLINLLSIYTGHSIGGFDAEKISGNSLVLGRGVKDEKFEAIGRGLLNIDGLPVYRDAVGPIGTPTSDEERTKITDSTRKLLMLVNMYGEETSSESTIDLIRNLFARYIPDSDNLDIRILNP